ncbi:MAG: Lrp/AsnC ligand binding domain-containing protein [Dehalococcoidia bacterium]|nr:Lrp/AsnC ligand binding domain-containing protein [Dehalococcoidia bacterium]
MSVNDPQPMSWPPKNRHFATPNGEGNMDNSGLPIVKLDELDLELVKELELNPRQSVRDLATKLRVSHATVHKRFRWLVDEGMIKFGAVCDQAALGFQVSVVVALHTRSGKAHVVANELAHNSSIMFVYLTSGRYDIIVSAVFCNRQEVLIFLDQQLSRIPDVINAETMMVLKFKKRSWMYLRGETVGYQEAARSVDQSELSLIRELELNPRASIPHLVKKTGMSRPSVTSKLQALLNDNILKVVTVADPLRFGFGVEAMILMRVELGSISSVADTFTADRRISKILILAGRFNIVLRVMFENVTEMSHFLTMELGSIPSIVEKETMIHVAHPKRVFSLPDR